MIVKIIVLGFFRHTSEIYTVYKEKYNTQAEEANVQAESVSVREMNELQTKSIRTLESAMCTSPYTLIHS